MGKKTLTYSDGDCEFDIALREWNCSQRTGLESTPHSEQLHSCEPKPNSQSKTPYAANGRLGHTEFLTVNLTMHMALKSGVALKQVLGGQIHRMVSPSIVTYGEFDRECDLTPPFTLTYHGSYKIVSRVRRPTDAGRNDRRLASTALQHRRPECQYKSKGSRSVPQTDRSQDIKEIK